MPERRLPQDAILHVCLVRCSDPHPSDGDYVRRFWTSALGPTATAMLGIFAREGGQRRWPVADLSAALGVGRKATTTSRKLVTTLERLATFKALDWTADNRVYVRSHMPRLSSVSVARLTPALQLAHAAYERQEVRA